MNAGPLIDAPGVEAFSGQDNRMIIRAADDRRECTGGTAPDKKRPPVVLPAG